MLTFVLNKANNVSMDTTLGRLPLRTPALINTIGGDRAFRRRLLELGFLPGTELMLLGAAPMGDPLEIEVRGCRFSLRKAEAEMIRVSPALPPVLAAAAK